MAIRYDRENKQFTLTTKNTKYVFDVLGDRYLLHRYYGKKSAEVRPYEPFMVSFAPYQPSVGNSWSPDIFPQEFSFFGSGDFRTAALKLRGADGSCVTDFVYSSYKKIRGRVNIDGIPCARAGENCETLAVTLSDSVTKCVLTLYYTVYYDEDIITRYLTLKNGGAGPVRIEKCMSLTLDLLFAGYDMVTLYGSHYSERHYQRVPLHHGMQSVYSRRGMSSPQYNPFMALCSVKASETRGDVYGFNFVWSGSFLDEVEVDQMNRARVQIGLGEENFGYLLEPGESFDSPEAVLTYSSRGFGKMSANFHDFTRRYVLPEYSTKHPHPVVLNTWEACYFNIDEDKLIKFAIESAKVGFDMLVMDDGWFGERKDDWAALGDWYPNPVKFKHGLKSFAEKVHGAGISFGIWIEPEMVNPNSDLYRAHPEWALSAPGRVPSESRQQLVLDMSNPEVIEYLKVSFDKTFRDVPIDYIKWDANRHLSDVYSRALPPERQDEAAFRYMKGVYALLEWFGKRFPDAPIESCSGGGGRYDLGMMRYGFQIWASDNTWPYDRLWMQRTALIAYPAATMSCHVSNPGDDLRSLDYRYKVAVGGMLGYELNILDMNDDIKAEMTRQVKEYKTFEHVIREGDYHSLVSPVENDHAAYYYASPDRREFVFSLIEKKDSTPRRTKPYRIREADRAKNYKEMMSGKTYSGAELRDGLVLDITGKDDSAILLYFKSEE